MSAAMDDLTEVEVKVTVLVDMTASDWRQAAFEQARDVIGEGDIENATIATEHRASTDPYVSLLRRWRNASLDGDLADLGDLTNETTDLLNRP